MMRIAFVTGGLPLGGSTTFTLFLSNALREMGVPAEVFSFTAANPLAKEFSEAGVPVHVQDERWLIYEDRLQNIYSELRAFQPTAVFAVLGAESFEALRYLPEGVLRIGIFHDRAIRPFVYGPRYRHTMDHLVVVAAYLWEEMRRFDPSFPCTYLAHGIPIPKGIEPRGPNPNEPLRLLYYGRFENISKGVRLFPEIVAALNRQKTPFVWTLHGYGPDKDFLKQALKSEVEQDRIVFSDAVKYKELPDIVRQHDIYMLASTNEGGPLTLLEGMALGLVPVCGDIPCLIQEVVTPQTGFRVPRGNPKAYAEAIARLHQNRPLLEQLSLNARNTITNHYSAEAMAKRYLAFLESLPAGKPVAWPERIRTKPILGLPWHHRMMQSFGIARQLRRLMKRI